LRQIFSTEESQVLQLFEKWLLEPIVNRTFKLEEAVEAHKHIESDKSFRKYHSG
jgi:NADPH:quinone reductase-like Zn-dependent oxidoreductase